MKLRYPAFLVAAFCMGWLTVAVPVYMDKANDASLRNEKHASAFVSYTHLLYTFFHPQSGATTSTKEFDWQKTYKKAKRRIKDPFAIFWVTQIFLFAALSIYTGRGLSPESKRLRRIPGILALASTSVLLWAIVASTPLLIVGTLFVVSFLLLVCAGLLSLGNLLLLCSLFARRSEIWQRQLHGSGIFFGCLGLPMGMLALFFFLWA